MDNEEQVDYSSLCRPAGEKRREKSPKRADDAACRKRSKQGKLSATRTCEDELRVICERYPHLTSERGHACLLVSHCTENECVQPLGCWDTLVDCMIPGRYRERWHALEESQTATGGRGRVSLPATIASCFLLRQSMLDSDQLHLSRLLFFFAHRLTVDNFLLALRAGFFVFAQPQDFSGLAQAENGIVCLELAGQKRDKINDVDHGGRVVLKDIQDLRIGKKTLKTLCDADLGTYDKGVSCSGQGNGSGSKNRVPYRLQVSVEAEKGREVWEACERAHGVDWMGYLAAKDLYMQVWSQQHLNNHSPPSCGNSCSSNNCCRGNVHRHGQGQVHLVSIALVDDRDGTVVSVEIGSLVGTLYSCISHATFDKEKYPRADRVRSNASALWMAGAGVRAFDVGTTAQYYADLSGYQRTSREEFVSLWRAHRDQGLERERFATMLIPCRRVHSLLLANKSSNNNKCGNN